MDTIEAIHTRRSIRRYADRAVPRALIEALVLDAAQAPVAPVSGAAPFHFSAAEGAARIAALGRRAHDYARANRPPGPGHRWIDRDDFLVFFNAPAVVVIAGWRAGTQATVDCNRAGQNLMLSARARGLATCWVGSPMIWLTSAEGRAVFRVPDGYDPVAAFTLGYADETPVGEPRPQPEIEWVDG